MSKQGPQPFEQSDNHDTLLSASSSTLQTAKRATADRIHFDLFTLFPAMFDSPLSESIINRARVGNLLTIGIHDIRHYTTDKHHTCDDTPYGGGGGMVMKAPPIFRAVETVLSRPAGWTLDKDDAFDRLPQWTPEVPLAKPDSSVPVILMTPQGRPLNQTVVQELSTCPRIALICGRYEGVDERVRTQLVTDEISVGDFVLSGGELAAMIVVDAVTRLIPGALGFEQSADQDSHSPGLDGLLEGPQYTRPHSFRGESAPDVLLSGHHANIARWHRQQALLRTLLRRPDLLKTAYLSEEDVQFLQNNGWLPGV